jgi:aerobic-type carbon monoxide dehydrogenase small subunit (CoxS/CutS family)
MAEKVSVTITVNGKEQKADVEPRLLLVHLPAGGSWG